MDAEEIRKKIKDVISSVTSIDPEDMSDNASFKDDVDVDSLTMLEITVDVDEAFDLELPEEEVRAMQTLQDYVDLVEKHLAEKV
jgi:acyl carrier protein